MLHSVTIKYINKNNNSNLQPNNKINSIES